MDYNKYYLDQINGLSGFNGSKIQRGYGVGSVFKRLFKWAIPIIKNYAEPVLQNAIKAGVSEISNGIQKFNDDINSDQKSIKESASERFQETVENMKKIIQKGSGKRKKPVKKKGLTKD